MYCHHESIDTPPDDTVIWRYLEFWKVVHLLVESKLWFARGDTLADNREGSLPLLNAYEVDAERADAKPFEKGLLDRYFIRNRTITYLNCWHIGAHESAAMWDLYIPGHDGVAIRSTVGRLKQAFATARPDVFIGLVNYIDYRTQRMEQAIGIPGPFYFKHTSYAYENELRAAIIQGHTSVTVDEWMREGGLEIEVALSDLIESIVISPRATPGFSVVLRTTANRLRSAVTISDSELTEEPRF